MTTKVMCRLLAVLLVVFLHYVSYAFTNRPSFQESASSKRIEKLQTHRMNWKNLEPSNFQTRNKGDDDGRQYAKDDNYLQAVLDLWEKEQTKDIPIQTSPFVYSYDNNEDDPPLFGHLVRRKRIQHGDDNKPTTAAADTVPGILLFHTAAGPQDVFLFYKAAILVQQFDCVVLICDIMSDEDGWGWDLDRTRYSKVRRSLLENNAELLKARITAACKAISLDLKQNSDSLLVDPQRIAAMGWCLGGLPILELARINQSSSLTSLDFRLKSMVTFHGVFHDGLFSSGGGTSGTTADGKTTHEEEEEEALSSSSSSSQAEVLICDGVDDPFVSENDVKVAKEIFEQHGFAVNILKLQNARHGFSNPAQSFNDNPSFDYNEKAATEAWDLMLTLLKRTLASE